MITKWLLQLQILYLHLMQKQEESIGLNIYLFLISHNHMLPQHTFMYSHTRIQRKLEIQGIWPIASVIEADWEERGMNQALSYPVNSVSKEERS